MLRARALEQALRETEAVLRRLDGLHPAAYSAVSSTLHTVRKALEVVDPSPSGASTQAETSRCAETCGLLRCRLNEGHSGLHQVYNAATGDFQQFIGQPAPVSPVEPTTCPKCRSNTRAYRLAVADVIDGRMAGMTSCRDEWHSRMPMVSPVEPEPPQVYHHYFAGATLTTCGVPIERGHVMPELNDVTCETCRQAWHERPVEPEPPTEAQFGEYERLKRQAREIEKALREAGCPAMPLEQGVRWLADKDFTTPLPPRPPAVVKPHRYDLVRYGVTWEGQDNQPLLTPMPDGYWTPWHLAVEAPTVEPEPCVWTRRGVYVAASCGAPRSWTDPENIVGWKVCPYCGAPLKVER